MRKSLHKITGIALSAAMIAVLAGCGNGGGAASTTAAPQTTQAATTAAATTAAATTAAAETTAAAAGTEAAAAETTAPAENDGIHFTSPGGITYPLQDMPTLTVWDGNNDFAPANVYSSYTESPFHNGLVERTGVNIEWQYKAAGANTTEAYNLLLTEDVLPNIIYKESWKAHEGQQLIDDGVIWDLTDYLPLYAPDYWERIHRPEYSSVLKTVMTDQGRFFDVATFNEGPYNDVYTGPVIRQDWLDECGLDTPVTMEDWENVLVTFKEKYNIAPFSFLLSRINTGGFASGTGAYGTFTARWYADDNGKVQLAQLQPEWVEYMEWLHKWYEMGLIDKDSVSMDEKAMRSKVLNGDAGVSLTTNTQLTNWAEDAATEGNGAKWVGVGYPRVSPDQPVNWTHIRARCVGHGGVITKSCSEEEMIAALKWLNYGYTDVGMMYWNFGTEGVSYYLDEEGLPEWTDQVVNDPDGMNVSTQKYIGVWGTGFSVQTERFLQIRYTEEAVQAIFTWIEDSEAQKHFIPGLSLLEDEQTLYNDTWSMISSRISEVAVQYMTGDLSLDGYDAFVKELYDMGLQTCQDIEQAAYDRYMAKQ